jgi:sugar phosphate isomerase/epimerase
MEFCVPTWAWGSRLPKDQHLPIDQALHRIAALGVSYAEFWIWQKADVAKYTPEHRAEIKKAVDDSGVRLVALDLHPYGMLSDSPDERAGAWDYATQCIDIAADLGVESITTITTAVPDDVSYDSAWNRSVDFLRQAVDYAGEREIAFCLEPEPGTITANGDSFLRIVTRVPNLKANVDIGHHHLVREQPWTVVEKIGADVAHVHLGDNDGTGDHSWAPGRGTIGQEGFVAFMKALQRVGFQGYYALDVHPAEKPDETIAESLAYLKALEV